MHRTTTSVALLVTVAASAVSGCVSVRAPAAADRHAPAAASSTSGAPHAGRDAEPQIVQAPAREALELIEPAGSAGQTRAEGAQERTTATSPANGRAPHGNGRTGARGGFRAEGNHGVSGGSRPGGGNAPGHGKPESRPTPPPSTAPATGTEVCGLGEQYGNWDPDSPQARICRDTYGS
ncbi:hypothetical protein P8605_21185 [Streptomyces sp. T-3]|nr:hypothetical protein [Streptomyces sp. T-3]